MHSSSVKLLVVSLLSFITIACAATQTVTFDILLFGDKIGTMVATEEVKSDGSILYTLETKSQANFLWLNRTNFTRYDVTYKDGKLLTSNHKEMENGKTKRFTNVKWDGAKYIVDSYKGKRTFTEIPTYSIVTIYFKDINTIKRIFYEAEADFSLLKATKEPETWEFKSSDGNRNIYHFKNGKIASMEFHVSIATVKMVRVN